MKRAFTIIELMITIVLMIMFVEFVFTYLLNITKEINYLKNSTKLVEDSFRVAEIMTKGVYKNNSYISGIMMAKSLPNEKSTSLFFDAQDNSNINIKIENNEFIIEQTSSSNSYIYNNSILKNFKIKKISENLYQIFFETLDNNKTIQFSRIVYVK